MISRILQVSFLFLALYTNNLNAQMDSDCPQAKAFGRSARIVFVRGSFADRYGERLNGWFRKQTESFRSCIVKNEAELDSVDLNGHLAFFGPVDSYAHLSRFVPKAVTILPDGFAVGPYRFTDSLDVLSLYTTDSLRRFQIGNSFKAVQSLWTTFWDISQYLIMQDYAVTHHGSLRNDEFDATRHYDVVHLRKGLLRMTETKHYKFFYPLGYFRKGEQKDLFAAEDRHVDRILETLRLSPPQRKIECYIYENLEQKYQLSATPGTGNTFPKAWQNHSIGLLAIEHESLHILFLQQAAGDYIPTFWAEGIMGYYYATVDTGKWRQDRIFVARHPHAPVKELMIGSLGFFDNNGYPISAHFVKFLVDTYGLDRFKQFCKAGDPQRGLAEVYGKPLDEMVRLWESYAAEHKPALGPDRSVTFLVRPLTIPDSSGVYIAGDDGQLGDWNPSGALLIRQTDGSWMRTFRFADGIRLSYKITRGSWETEATAKDDSIPPNSIIDVQSDSTISIVVENWKDNGRRE